MKPMIWWRLSLSLVVVFTVAALATSCAEQEKALRFTITFEDAKYLQSGQNVVYKGIRIGEVTDVSLDPGGSVKVDVKIDSEYRATVYREAKFLIEEPSATDSSGEKQITVKDSAGERTPIRDGEVIEGTEGLLHSLSKDAKDAARTLWDHAKTASEQIREEFEDARSSPEGQQFEESLKEYMEKAEEMGREAYDDFKEDELPRIKEEARELRDKILDEEGEEKASEFWDQFKEWLDSIGDDAPEEESESSTQ